jgi:hypothetical protein
MAASAAIGDSMSTSVSIVAAITALGSFTIFCKAVAIIGVGSVDLFSLKEGGAVVSAAFPPNSLLENGEVLHNVVGMDCIVTAGAAVNV